MNGLRSRFWGFGVNVEGWRVLLDELGRLGLDFGVSCDCEGDLKRMERSSKRTGGQKGEGEEGRKREEIEGGGEGGRAKRGQASKSRAG